MSSETAIYLQQVSKVFEIYNRPSDRLKQILWGHERKFYREFWAVKSVDMKVHRGETVGIVGRNGAGKSTLLQMICGTLKPTSGSLTVNGRVAALLELGSGFNPEFTGQENIFMYATILGLSREEILERYDSILAFADIGDFVNQPVKLYSSGMYARLAFAIAINVDPDILVVDEALSVGDEAFQRKCFAHIESLRRSGCTILFVSHAAGSVIELCDRAILMDHGERLLTGTPKAVVSRYQKLIYAPADQLDIIRDEIRQLDQGLIPDPSLTPQPTQSTYIRPAQADANLDEYFDPNLQSKSRVEYYKNGAEISNIRIENQDGSPVNVLLPNKQYRYRYDVTITRPAFGIRCGMMIKSVTGIELGGIVTHPIGHGLEYAAQGTQFTVSLDFWTVLNSGTYFFNAGIVGWINGQEEYLHRIVDAIAVCIPPRPDSITTGNYIDFSNGQAGLIEFFQARHPPSTSASLSS